MSEMIKVTPEYLIQKQEDLLGALQAAEQNFMDATQELTHLEACFCAETMTFLEETVLRQQKAGNIAFAGLGRQIRKLSEIAEVYFNAERSNTDAG